MSKRKTITPQLADEEMSARLEAIAASETLTQGQQDIFMDTILELSSCCNIYLNHPDIIRAFWNVLKAYEGSDELAEVVSLIDAGETFEDYDETGLEGWKIEREKKEAERLNPRPPIIECTITEKWHVAYDYAQGDTVQVRTDVEPEDGSLVAVRWTDSGKVTVCYLYRCQGKVWKYKLLRSKRRTKQHHRAKAHDIEILGVVTSEAPEREQPKSNNQLDKLRAHLEETELLPENEATRFQLMTEIHRLENALPDEEWPEVVGDE